MRSRPITVAIRGRIIVERSSADYPETLTVGRLSVSNPLYSAFVQFTKLQALGQPCRLNYLTDGSVAIDRPFPEMTLVYTPVKKG